MDMSLSQARFVELTMKLDLKAREYKMLCEKYEKCKNSNKDDREEKLYALLDEFKANNDDVITIRNELRILQESNMYNREVSGTTINEKVEVEELSNKEDELSSTHEDKTSEHRSNQMPVVVEKDSIWARIKNKIKSIFGK